METKEQRRQASRVKMAVQVGFDVLDILAARFEKEMGQAFNRLWNESLEGTEGLPRILLEGVQPGAENREINAHIVRMRWEDRGEPDDPRPIQKAFLEVVDAQLEAAHRVLGRQIVEQAAGEAHRVLSLVDKYEADSEVVRAFMERLRAVSG